jgi:Rod binding domain-containing protein
MGPNIGQISDSAMSISPPSDIILDVTRAADPVREQRAIARLSQMAAAESESFDRVLDASASQAVTSKSAAPADPPPAAPPPAAPWAAGPSGAEKVFRSFEAMALASMIEAAMPKDGDTIFGSGTAGRAWKSMLAEQIGMQMAEAGGIGIANQLASAGQLAGEAGESDKAKTASIAESLLVAQIERGFIDAAMPDAVMRDEDRSS